MEKKCLFIVCLLASCVLFSGCNIQQDKSPIKYQRRLEKYLPEQTQKTAGGTIDLSEGPKTRYDAKFGPKDLNFDIKIHNPY